MANTVYRSGNVELIDGRILYITPLKIKYLRQFMQEFSDISKATDDIDAMGRLAKCVAIAMKQYSPDLATVDAVEDSLDVKTMYKILELSADIQIGDSPEKATVKENLSNNQKKETWDSFDLAKLESELFLLGIWKDYEDLEMSLSMPELTATLTAKRELDYNEKKFLAAMQGVNLDEASGKDSQEDDPWEAVKRRAEARARGEDPNAAEKIDPNDILSFTGTKAQQAGFGLGMGIEYTKM